MLKVNVVPPKHDYFTKHGAAILVNTIREYWGRRGFAVKVERHEIPGFAGMYAVRSNLLGGVPR